ncbi:MAG TPA: hypothetical protein VNE17_08245 [Nitrolancea sp.]|nr:hypothetical protein [Nitrolancea sp.]
MRDLNGEITGREPESPKLTTWKTIEKPRNWGVTPNLVDYDMECSSFSWDEAMEDLNGLPDGKGLNIGYEAVDRHAKGELADHLANRWLGSDGEIRDFSYAELRDPVTLQP